MLPDAIHRHLSWRSIRFWDQAHAICCKTLRKNSLYLYCVLYLSHTHANTCLIKSSFIYAKKLQRSRIKDNTNDNRNIVSELRTSSSVFITEEHKRVQYVCQRVSDMTKLSAIDAEALQVVNYGIGGHYVPHIDAFDEADSSEFRTGSGNRIATVLFYVSPYYFRCRP